MFPTHKLAYWNDSSSSKDLNEAVEAVSSHINSTIVSLGVCIINNNKWKWCTKFNYHTFFGSTTGTNNNFVVLPAVITSTVLQYICSNIIIHKCFCIWQSTRVLIIICGLFLASLWKRHASLCRLMNLQHWQCPVHIRAYLY